MNFHEVRFPAALSVGSSGGPERRTEIVALSNGFEERNSPWAHSRRRYDAGLGVRSLDDLAELIAFFEARHGQLYGFRWKDWTDFKSCAPSATPAPIDQRIGNGRREHGAFALGKTYASGAQAYVRPIAKPVAGTVRVAVGGVPLAPGRASRSITRPAGAPGDGAGCGGAGDRGVRVRRSGAVRHRPDHHQPRRVRRGRDPVDPGRRGAGLMRAIDPELQARLDGGATQLCRCWLVRRRDGAEFGFTDHDRDLSFDGVVFRASSGMDASALQSATGLSVDNAQAVGALSDAAVSEEDIRAGKYDGAEVRHWLVDWERPDLRVLMFRGHFGEIRRLGRRVRGRVARAGGGAERAGRPVDAAHLRPGAGGCEVRLRSGRAGFAGEGGGRGRLGGRSSAAGSAASPTAGSRMGR